MFAFHRLTRLGSVQIIVASVAVGSWLTACGDDEEGGGGKGGSSGTAGTATGGTATGGTATGGTAGSATGGKAGSSTGGSGGGLTGGTGGALTGGSGGAGPTGGTAGTGMGGEGGDNGGQGGEGGEGAVGPGGQGGDNAGGEGGTPGAMCVTGNLSFNELMSTPNQVHDHLPINGTFRTTFLNMVNNGAPLVFTLPTDGTNAHNHTLTFTAPELTTLRNGGTIASITSSMGGPANNMHTHTYSIDCAP